MQLSFTETWKRASEATSEYLKSKREEKEILLDMSKLNFTDRVKTSEIQMVWGDLGIYSCKIINPSL